MGYQIPLDLGLCIIKSVTKRCHLTASHGCKQTDDRKAAIYFSGKTSSWLARGITHPPSKIKVPIPISTECHPRQVSSMKHLGECHISAWYEVHTGSALGRPSSPQPDNSTWTTLRLLGGVELLEKREREREKSLNIERNIQMIKLSCIRAKGKEEEVVKQAALQNALRHDETD